jgi:hypothetical protein
MASIMIEQIIAWVIIGLCASFGVIPGVAALVWCDDGYWVAWRQGHIVATIVAAIITVIVALVWALNTVIHS